MTIIYKKYRPDWQQLYEEYATGHTVLYFDPCAERYEQSLTDRFLGLDNALRNCDTLILRGRTSKFVANLENSRSALQEHANDKTILALVGGVLWSDGNLEPRLIPLLGPEQTPGFDAPLLRQIEIDSFLQRNDAIFAPSDHHYSLPSGDHVQKFLRLACALQDPIEVARLADWLLPYVAQRTMIIGDTGTLLPLFYAVRSEAKSIFDANVSIRVLDRYPRAATAVAQIVEEGRAKLGLDGGTLLFVISVNSTGRLLQFIQQMAPNDNILKSVVVVIVNTSEASGTAQVLHTHPIARYKSLSGQCELCRKPSPVFSIDGRTYERLPHPVWHPVHITKEKASSQIDFWKIVDQTRALEFNRNYQGGYRHYSLYLDVARLMEADSFSAQVRQNLAKLGQPAAIVVPRHESTAVLVSTANAVFPDVPIFEVERGTLTENLRHALRSMHEDQSVLILDDAYVEGVTLSLISDQIYGVNRALRRQAFVLLARPSNSNNYKRTVRSFIFASKNDGNHFGSGFYVPLPKHNVCPWGSEREILTSIIASGATGLSPHERRLLQDRVLSLEGRKFFPPILANEGYDGDQIIAGSYFGELREATLYAAATSACQACRDDVVALQTGSVVPFINLEIMFRNYFDRNIISAVLRTFSYEELSRYGVGENLVDPLARLIQGNSFGNGMIEEILWAAYLRKLPRDIVLSLVEEKPNKSPMVDILIRLIRNDA